MVADKAEELTRLAIRLLVGDGVEQSPLAAARVLEEAIEAGCGRAAKLMAVIAGTGITGRRSWSEALNHLETAARLGEREAQLQLALLTDDLTASAHIDASPSPAFGILRQAREAVDVRRWIAPKQAGLLSRTPHIATFPRFIEPNICCWLIQRGSENPQTALVYDGKTGAARPDLLRTNTASTFGIADVDLVMLLVQARIAASIGVTTARMESPSVLQYDVGQRFAGHVDFLDPSAPEMKSDIELRGQRIATFLIYLNDDFEGGETEFPVANLRYRARSGGAILFYNVRPDGTPDQDSMHAGLPPTSGCKALLSQWIRDRPQPIV